MTERLQKALNEQITAELWSANLYLSMSYFLLREGYEGFAHWMRKQSAEETMHANKIAEYMINRQAIYNALFTLKDAGIDISNQLKIMQETKGVPYEVLNFLRDNSPQFQFYGYIQKHQKGLCNGVRNGTRLEGH